MAKILVVDDDAQLRSTVGQMLQAAGFERAIAENGAQALEKARRERFDLLLTDIWMPEMTGLELLSKLQAESTPLRAIVMTGDDAPEIQLQAIRARAFQYIVKPFTSKQLIDLIHEVLAAPPDAPSIEVLSALPNWIELLVPCDLAAAERIHSLLENMKSDLPAEVCRDVARAFREILMNAVEWGGRLDPRRKVRVSYLRGRRMLLYRIADPGPGFKPEDLAHAAVSNPADDPARHLEVRNQKGIRPGGFGLMMARAMVDELIYNEAHNEVVLIKYLDGPQA